MNKDQWYNVLEFSRTVHADLSNYDEDGACKYNMFSYKNKILTTIAWENNLCSITVKDLNLTVTCTVLLLQIHAGKRHVFSSSVTAL